MLSSWQGFVKFFVGFTITIVIESVPLAVGIRDVDRAEFQETSSNQATADATLDGAGCSSQCIQPRKWQRRRQGYWKLETVTNRHYRRHMPINQRAYYAVQIGHSCEAQSRLNLGGMEQVQVVPVLNAEDPINQSEVHVHVDPMLLMTLREHYVTQDVRVCEFSEPPSDLKDEMTDLERARAEGFCLCTLSIPKPARSTIAASSGYLPSFILHRLGQLHADCVEGVPLLFELALESLILGAVLVSMYTLWRLNALSRAPREPHGQQEGEEEEEEEEGPRSSSEVREELAPRSSEWSLLTYWHRLGGNWQAKPKAGVIIKSPWELHQDLLLKLVGVVLISITLQTLFAQLIMPVSGPVVMYGTLGLILLFSFATVLQAVLTSAQYGIVYAVLGCGFAVSHKTAGVAHHWYACLFLPLLLGLIVYGTFANLLEHQDKMFTTTVIALAGPVWKVLMEYLRTRSLQQELCNSLVTINARVVAERELQDAPATAETEQTSTSREVTATVTVAADSFETKLASGKVCLIPLGALIKAGRAKESLYEVCQAFQGASAHPDASPPTVYGVLDLHWHGHAIYKLTGSRWGFSQLPMLCGAVVILCIASLLQTVAYACLVPKLGQLSLQAAGARLSFKPWQYEYIVELDASFRAVELTMAYDARFMRGVRLDDGRSMPSSWLASEPKQLHLPGAFPFVANILVENVHGSIWNYSLHFLPTEVVPSLLTLEEGGDVEPSKRRSRIVHFSQMEGSNIAIPPDIDELILSVAVKGFALTLPVRACDARHGYYNVDIETVYCGYHGDVGNKSKEEECRNRCRLRGGCLASFPLRKDEAGGCFFVTETRTAFVGRVRSTRKVSITSLSRLCYARDCLVSQHDDSQVIFPPLRLDRGADDIALVMRLALSPNHQQFDSVVEHLQLHRGPPPPTAVLALLELRRCDTNVLDEQLCRDQEANKIARTSVYSRSVFKHPTVEAAGQRYIVTLPMYWPRVTGINLPMVLHLALLVADPTAEVSWTYGIGAGPGKDTREGTNSLGGDFDKCKTNRFIEHRYGVCPSVPWIPEDDRWGSLADVTHIKLDPWDPKLDIYGDVRFNITTPAWNEGGLGDSRSFEIVMRQGPVSPVWLQIQSLLEDKKNHSAKGHRRPCRFDWHVDILETLLTDTDLLCELTRLLCPVRFLETGRVPSHSMLKTGMPVMPHKLLVMALDQAWSSRNDDWGLRVLSCAWSVEWVGTQRHHVPSGFIRPEFDPADGAVQLIYSGPRPKTVTFSPSVVFQHALYRNDVKLVQRICSDVDPKLHLSGFLTALAELMQSGVDVSVEMFQTFLACTQHGEANASSQAIEALSSYAVRKPTVLKITEHLFATQDARFRTLWLSKMIEAKCWRCMPYWPQNVSIDRLKLTMFLPAKDSIAILLKVLQDRHPKLDELSIEMHGDSSVQDFRRRSVERNFSLAMSELRHLKKLELLWVPMWCVRGWLHSRTRSGLKALSIRPVGIEYWEANDVDELCKALEDEAETLEEVSLRSARIRSQWRKLASTVPKLTRLTTLRIENTQLKGSTCSLAYNCSGSEAYIMMEELPPTLIEIDLSGNYFDDEFMRHFAGLIRPLAHQLEVVDLGSQLNDLTSASVEYLLSALADAPRLRVFRLYPYVHRSCHRTWALWCDEKGMQDFNNALIKGLSNVAWPNITEVTAYCPELVNLMASQGPDRIDQEAVRICNSSSFRGDLMWMDYFNKD